MGRNIATPRATFNGFFRRIRLLSLLVFVFPLILTGCSRYDETALERARRVGEIRVLTHEGSATYYETPEGPAGFEYDLAKAFADSLGLRLKVVVAARYADVLPRLLKGDADFAAAGIAESEAEHGDIQLTPSYQEVRQQFVYRLGGVPPENLPDAVGREIEVTAGTQAVKRLNELLQSYPDLSWIESPDRNPEELLQLVWEGLLDLTVADSNTVTVNRQYFPELQIAFEAPHTDRLAWAFSKSADTSIYDAAVKFIKEQRASGGLAQLTDRYYGPAARSNFVNLAVYRLRVLNRLPQYRAFMEAAAKKHNLDWRLIAAVGYQESYWDATSVSPTGVRGFMMLTRDTAEELGVLDRQDPGESIDGGARYLRYLLDRLPPRIKMPDRLWFALAAYNVGLSHLEDARIITQKQGGDPTKWSDVKQRLPLLADPKWHTKTKYGHARGEEPVRFVNRVRTYYDVLAKIDDEEKAKRTTHALKFKSPAL